MSETNPQEETLDPTGSVAEQTPSEEKNPPAEVTEEMIKDHPLYKELAEKHSTAEREAKRWKGRLDKTQKDPKEDSPAFVTRDELWESEHREDIELYSDEEYEKDIEEGVPKHKALQYAKLRYEKSPSDAQTQRQQSMASQGASSTRDIDDIDITDKDREDMKKWGYSEATLLKHKQMKKERGQ